MPNYVTNVVTARPEVIAAMLDDDRETVDFARLVPPPANLETGDCSGTHEPGVVCWYDWRLANWGCKWNAGETEAYGTEATASVKFLTAWAHPVPIIEALSARFPDDDLGVEFADEDIGRNCGSYVMRDGCITRQATMTQADANDFAAFLVHEMSYAELQAQGD